MKCTACKKELNKKDVVFTEDKKPYCQNPFQCNEEHPNSVANILARGGAVNLFTEDELENNIFERLNISEEMKDRILKVATKPQSIRLSKYEIAHYLIALQEQKELASISEAVRYCVQLAMTQEPIKEKHKAVNHPTFTVNQSALNIPDVPKSVNVDFTKLKTDEQVTKELMDNIVPEPEEEEMTF